MQKRWSKAMVKGSRSVHVLVGAIGQLLQRQQMRLSARSVDDRGVMLPVGTCLHMVGHC